MVLSHGTLTTSKDDKPKSSSTNNSLHLIEDDDTKSITSSSFVYSPASSSSSVTGKSDTFEAEPGPNSPNLSPNPPNSHYLRRMSKTGRTRTVQEEENTTKGPNGPNAPNNSPSMLLQRGASFRRAKNNVKDDGDYSASKEKDISIIDGDKLKGRLGGLLEVRGSVTTTTMTMSSTTFNATNNNSIILSDQEWDNEATKGFHSWMWNFFDMRCIEFDGDADYKEVARHVDELKYLFMHSMKRVEFCKNDYLFKRGEKFDKVFVIEEGKVLFTSEEGEGIIGEEIEYGPQAVLGEMSLVYHEMLSPIDLKCISPRVVAWAMDAGKAREALSIRSFHSVSRVRD